MLFWLKQMLLILGGSGLVAFSVAHASHPKHLSLKPTAKQAKIVRQTGTNDLLKQFLTLSSYRNQVLAANIANLNTPGYKAREVKSPTNYQDLVANKARNIKLLRTTPKHLASKNSSEAPFKSSILADPFEVKKNGNTVNLSQQIIKVNQNKQDYNTTLKTYATLNSLISTAVGR